MKNEHTKHKQKTLNDMLVVQKKKDEQKCPFAIKKASKNKNKHTPKKKSNDENKNDLSLANLVTVMELLYNKYINIEKSRFALNISYINKSEFEDRYLEFKYNLTNHSNLTFKYRCTNHTKNKELLNKQ